MNSNIFANAVPPPPPLFLILTVNKIFIKIMSALILVEWMLRLILCTVMWQSEGREEMKKSKGKTGYRWQTYCVHMPNGENYCSEQRVNNGTSE